MKRIGIAFAAIAALALLVAVAPATAKPQPKTSYWEITTAGGEEVHFALTGKRLSEVNSYIWVTCVPTHGAPTTGTTEFDPPGSFVIGKARKASETETLPYKGDVTKNYELTFEKKGSGWIVHLHLNYSYEEVFFGYGSEIEQKFVICQGDDEFRF